MQGWRGFLLWRIGLKRPFHASAGTSKFFINDNAKRAELSAWLRRWYKIWPLEEDESANGDGTFKLRFGTRTLQFRYTKRTRSQFLGILKQFFLKEPYGALKVEGRVVVDIGADIGDSAIYFCCKGAEQVISLEPYLHFYDVASGNILANGFQDKVVLVNEGAGRNGEVTVDPEAKVPPWSELKESTQGIKVRINNLRNLIERFHLESAVLKVNCEGCEYGLFNEATIDDLTHFSQIMLEYHHESKPIIAKLRAAGFSTKRWHVRRNYNPNTKGSWTEKGYILATR